MSFLFRGIRFYAGCCQGYWGMDSSASQIPALHKKLYKGIEIGIAGVYMGYREKFLMRSFLYN